MGEAAAIRPSTTRRKRASVRGVLPLDACLGTCVRDLGRGDRRYRMPTASDHSGQMLEVGEVLGEVLGAAGGSFVLDQILQADEGNLGVINRNRPPAWMTLTELDAGEGGEDVNSEGRYSHSDNLIWLKEELWRQIGGCKAKFANGLRDLGGILWVHGDPQV